MSTGKTKPHVVITGPMGVGKSTTANALAGAIGWSHRDSDTDIETLLGVNGAQVAIDHGVDELHRMESAVLLGALAQPDRLVVSAAAWVVEDMRCREALASRAAVVVLHASADEVMKRIGTGEHRRAMDRAEFEALAVRRAPMFASLADLALPASEPTDRLVEQIRSALSL